MLFARYFQDRKSGVAQLLMLRIIATIRSGRRASRSDCGWLGRPVFGDDIRTRAGCRFRIAIAMHPAKQSPA
jgi:hypothetical protein